MADAIGTKRSSRRALLGAAAGATAATIVGAALRPLPTQAATDTVTYTNNQNGVTVITGQSLVQGGFPQLWAGYRCAWRHCLWLRGLRHCHLRDRSLGRERLGCRHARGQYLELRRLWL